MQRLLAAIFVYATLVWQPLGAQSGGAASAKDSGWHWHGKAVKADDGPTEFLAGRVGNELLRRGIVDESACNIGGGQPLTDFDEEAAAGDFSCERISHGCASVTSGFVACGFLLGAS